MNPQRCLSLRFTLIPILLTAAIAWHGQAKAGSIALNWDDNSTEEVGFNIERQTQTKGKKQFIQIATVGANINSYIDTGIEGGTTYCYRVSAFNTYELSDYSNISCRTYELVANAGQNQSITDSDGNGVETVALNGSGSYGAIVSYKWTETATVLGTGVTFTQNFSVGSRNVTLTVTDTDGLTDGDDVFITVLANQSATTAVVEDITYAIKDGKNLRLKTRVSIIESLGPALANASVTLDLLRDGALVTSKTLTSRSDGSASFQLNKAGAGCYETVIVDVVADGLTWDGVTPTNKYCVQ